MLNAVLNPLGAPAKFFVDFSTLRRGYRRERKAKSPRMHKRILTLSASPVFTNARGVAGKN
jgi:hypothetical protein